MIFRRRLFLIAVAMLSSAACESALHCTEKGGVEERGTCTCAAGMRPDPSGEHCVADTARNDASPNLEGGAGDATLDLTEDASLADAGSSEDAGDYTDAATGGTSDAGDASVLSSTDAQTPAATDGSVILDLSMRQPPTTVPVNEWPAEMRTGRWRFTWTPNFASTAVPVDTRPYVILFQFGGTGNSNDAIWLEKQGTICKAWVTTDSGVLLSIQSLVFAAGQPITYEFDLPRGAWTTSGATSGNGTVTNGSGFVWPSATLFVGRSPAGEMERFMGTFSDVVLAR